MNGEYNQSSDQPYVRDELYANDASHFISAYQLLEADLMKLFTFIEPADANLSTYSHRLYELLLRASTEFEANARAVLVANGYSKTGRWNIFDYAKLEPACRLSAFATTLPVWRGSDSVRRPFSVWAKNQNASLPWYADYNSVKHNRSGEFELATLGNVIDAVSGVFIMLFAQFNMVVWNPYGNLTFYATTPSGALIHPSSFFQITLPSWEPDNRYDFEWKKLKATTDPIAKYSFPPSRD